MRKLAVVVGLLLISSVADAKTVRQYQDNKKAYCEALQISVAKNFELSQKARNRDDQDYMQDRAAQRATIFIALCKD